MKVRAKTKQFTQWQTLLVVITDPFAKQQPALQKAAAIARRSGCRVRLFNTFLIPEPINSLPMDEHADIVAAAIQHRCERLRQLAAGVRLKSAQCSVQWGFPTHEVIVREVLKSKADLLLTDSHRHGRLARWMLTNTDWELMRTCPCPVWLVRSGKLPSRPKLLVAVDPRRTGAKPADLDTRLLGTATELASSFGGSVSVVHAYQTSEHVHPGLLRRPIRRASSILDSYAASARDTVVKLCRAHDVDASRCAVVEGVTRDVIADIAENERADILIMGVVSRSLMPRPVIGGTAEAVIDHVGCDVLVIKPRGFKTPVRARRSAAPRAGVSRGQS